MFSYIFMKILEGRPRSYDRFMDKVSGGRILSVKKAVAAELRGTGRVLEIGCGTGQLAAMLAAQGVKVDGFDVSPGMAEITAQRILTENLKNNFSVRMMGVDAMDTLPGASYDAVVSTLVFSELSDDERLFAVKHAARVLKTNGLIVIADEVVPRKSLNKLLYAAARVPMRMKDIPAYLNNGQRRTEEMKRVSYSWRERLDTAAGSLFPFFFVGAVGFLVFGPGLLLNYLVIGPAAFFFFMLTCPWMPGKRGLTKVILPEVLLASVWIATEVFNIPSTFSIRPDIIITMVMLLIYSSELGGLAPTMPSDLDAFLARMGFGAIGNVAFAGTVRTELLNGLRVLTYCRAKCVGCRNCVEVCPQGCWELDDEQRGILAQREDCTACRACLVQCEGGAIKAEPTS